MAEYDPETFTRAIWVLNTFRAAHQKPLGKINMGLRSFVATTGVHGNVTQRLKRAPRITRKLHRMEGMNLARLEDIGGCRVVVDDGLELDRLRSRVERIWRSQIVRTRDYIEEPKDLGYRAVHLVVERDQRRIEIQLRTRGQQQWADAIEAADSRLSMTLKDGTGPEEMVEYFTATGELIFRNEYGLPADIELIDRFEAARRAVIEAGHYSE